METRKWCADGLHFIKNSLSVGILQKNPQGFFDVDTPDGRIYSFDNEFQAKLFLKGRYCSHCKKQEGTPILRFCKRAFVLTGSRWFGNARENSDWDFIVRFEPTYIAWASNHGFIPAGTKYEDADLVLFNKEENIHLQFCKDFQRKCNANEILKPILKNIPKEFHREIWRACLKS